jgi:hypothetical protein
VREVLRVEHLHITSKRARAWHSLLQWPCRRRWSCQFPRLP